jgi:Ca2+/Na+ antiporter
LVEGLKSSDPRQVGRYRIAGLLGAGGMVTAAVLGSCAAVLAVLRRSSWTSVPRGIRRLHLLTATLAVGLFAFWAGVMLHDRGDLSFLEAGSWIFTAGCAALIHSTVRLWRPGASTRALLQR